AHSLGPPGVVNELRPLNIRHIQTAQRSRNLIHEDKCAKTQILFIRGHDELMVGDVTGRPRAAPSWPLSLSRRGPSRSSCCDQVHKMVKFCVMAGAGSVFSLQAALIRAG